MFFLNLLKSFVTREKNETGAGLMTVLGVTLVLVVAASTITSSLIFSSNFTSAKLSENQAKSEAESGIIDAISKYASSSDKCESNGVASDEKGKTKYKFSVYRSTSATMPTSTGSSGTQAGCPSEAGSEADKWILIKSTGFGKNNTSSEKVAVYKVQPKHMSFIPQAITGRVVALSYSTQINKADGVLGDNKIYVTDTFKCDVDTRTGVVVNGNITYQSSKDFGGFPGNQSCLINGNMNIDITDTSITSTDLSNFTSHGGYICLKNTSLPNANAPKEFFSQKPAGKLFKKTECNIDGTRYGYVPDMSDSTKLTGSGCNTWSSFASQTKVASEKNGGEDNILDTTSCDIDALDAMLNDTTAKELKVNGDITLLFEKQFNMYNTTIKSYSSSKRHNVNFVIPSKTANDSESSYDSSKVVTSVFTNVKYESEISGMIYTPRSFTSRSSSVINGQVYAGYAYSALSTTFNYVPVGLPNAEVKIKDIGMSKDLIRVY